MLNQTQECALLIIDMQNDFVLPGSSAKIAGAKATIPVIQKVLNSFRKANLPVFHAVREYRADGSDIELTRLENFLEKSKMLVPGTYGCEIVGELQPVPGEYRIVKNRYSAFFMTELDLILRRLGIEHIVICGTQYPSCVRATIFDALSYNYFVTMIIDGCSAQTSEIGESNIRDIKDLGVECLTGSEFIKRLNAK
ncbi:MAG: cysteine hydrolase [Victivallales bacterium]|nr:cysteine hydrolase [Victivallales bacterium]